MGSKESHTTDTTKRGQRDYTDEALASLNHPKLLMDLWMLK